MMAKLSDMALTKDDRFAVAQALYWYCADYHGGQNSKEYQVLSQLHYTPGMLERAVDETDSTARSMYEDLVSGQFDCEDVLDWIQGDQY